MGENDWDPYVLSRLITFFQSQLIRDAEHIYKKDFIWSIFLKTAKAL